MIKSLLTICCALIFAAGTAIADDDVVRIKLDTAKLKYEQEIIKHRGAVRDWIDKREEVARKDGDKKMLEQVKGERRAFDDKGELSKTAPDELKQNFAKARATLETAYATAIREYIQVKKDYEATVVEKELQKFKTTSMTGIASAASNGAFPALTPEMLKAKLAGKATYDQKTGTLTISYRFADKAELADFDCGEVRPRFSGGFMKLEPAESIKHIVQFDALTVTSIVNVPVMKGRVYSTSGGTVMAGSGMYSEAVYLDMKGSNGPVFQVVPENVRSGLVRIEMRVDEKTAVVHWGKVKLGRELKEPGAGRLELSGGECGYAYSGMAIWGRVNPQWAEKFFELK
jgi:hypothetical protein